MKVTVADTCTDLQTYGELRSLVADTPNEELTYPNDKDSVIDRFDLEAARIVAVSKMRALVQPRKEVYQTRFVRFHWDLSSVVETRQQHRTQTH